LLRFRTSLRVLLYALRTGMQPHQTACLVVRRTLSPAAISAWLTLRRSGRSGTGPLSAAAAPSAPPPLPLPPSSSPMA
jgi:hypothetical protein